MSWEPQRGESTNMRDPNSEGRELRRGVCRAGWIGRQSKKYKDYLGATFTWHLERLMLEDDCPIPHRTAGGLSFILCSLQHKTAGYVLPLLFIDLPGLFSTLSQFPATNFDYSVNIC